MANPSSSVSSPSTGDASTGMNSGNPQLLHERVTEGTGHNVHELQVQVLSLNQSSNSQMHHQLSLSTKEVTSDNSAADGQKTEQNAKSSTPRTSESLHRAGNTVQNTSAGSFEFVKSVDGLVSRNYSELNDNGSAYSYEAPTTTLDSAFGWISDYTEETPQISDEHPLLKLRGIALRILRNNFQAWKAHGNEQNTSSPSGPAQRAGAPTRRTKKGNQRNNDDDDDDMDDQGSFQGRLGGSSSKRAAENKGPSLSCPFYKKDPRKHHVCCKFVLNRIRDVKQHLNRCHRMPLYCPRCSKVFKDEDWRDYHIRTENCQEGILQKPEGISESQKKQLQRKVSSTQPEPEQWFSIFDILFPDHVPRPTTPYIDTGLLQNVQAFQDFSVQHGPRILDEVLMASGAVQWLEPPHEHDRIAFRNRVLEDAIRAISTAWASRATGTEIPETPSNTMTLTSQSLPVDNLGMYQYGSQASNSSRPIPSFGDGTETQMMVSPTVPSYATSSQASESVFTSEGWLGLPMSENNLGQGFIPTIPLPLSSTEAQDQQMYGNFPNFNFYNGASGQR